MTTVTLRIESNLKKDIQEMAKSLGLSLNQLINLKLRKFREKWDINISIKNNITEFWELSENDITSKMLNDLNNAKKLSKSDFVNL